MRPNELKSNQLSEGDEAPDFTLQGVYEGDIGTFTLSDQIDRGPAVIGFYVYDFSPVCTDQLCDLADMEWLELEENVSVIAIGSDGPYSHLQFAEENDISFPLLSDTSQEVSEAYGVLHEEKGGLKRVPQRATFLIDTDQRIRHKWIADDNWEDWEMHGQQPTMEILEEARTLA